MALDLNQLNRASHEEFVALLDGTYEHSPWIAERAWSRRPFNSLAHLKLALSDVVRNSTRDDQLKLIRAHRSWPARRWSIRR
jgi:N-carbamoyl-L-amino-acid hydrolase